MHKQMKAAIAVEAVVLAIALGFSVFYVAKGMYHVNHLLDVLLVVLWMLVAGALLLVFRSRTLQREEMVRRFYLSREWLYNHEIGYVPIPTSDFDSDAYELVMFAADALARMSYGFELADAPNDFEPLYLISNRVFAFHFVGEGDPEDRSVVVDQWEGTLQKVVPTQTGEHDHVEVGAFLNAKELAQLLERVEANEEENALASNDELAQLLDDVGADDVQPRE